MINRKLLPIKAHFFFFMAALGPILPQLQVFGKELGVSSVIMGTVTGILPFAYLLAKPMLGMIVDVYRDYRKTIFMGLIFIMAVSYGSLIFIPLRSIDIHQNKTGASVTTCNELLDNITVPIKLECSTNCSNDFLKHQEFFKHGSSICVVNEEHSLDNTSCEFRCKENEVLPDEVLLKSVSFWFFVAMLSIGTITFNVVNSISDAVCFDVIGEEYDYGKQRIWGTIGYGITALLSGYVMDNFFQGASGYKPAIYLMLVFSLFDLASCVKLKLPIVPAPKHIWKELATLMKYKAVVIFLIFTILAGTADGFLTYFLLWYVEDVAQETNTQNVKLLEGCIIAAESFGGEVLFFYLGDNILKKLGHVKCFSVCFLLYAARLGTLSIIVSPWTTVIIEFFLQGPTYALTYLTIVAYANEIAPSGASATMQGIAAGLDDGLGYAFGSLFGGILYRYVGPRQTFQIFFAFSLIAGIAHYLIHLCFTNKTEPPVSHEAEYSSVSQACN